MAIRNKWLQLTMCTYVPSLAISTAIKFRIEIDLYVETRYTYGIAESTLIRITAKEFN